MLPGVGLASIRRSCVPGATRGSPFGRAANARSWSVRGHVPREITGILFYEAVVFMPHIFHRVLRHVRLCIACLVFQWPGHSWLALGGSGMARLRLRMDTPARSNFLAGHLCVAWAC